MGLVSRKPHTWQCGRDGSGIFSVVEAPGRAWSVCRRVAWPLIAALDQERGERAQQHRFPTATASQNIRKGNTHLLFEIELCAIKVFPRECGGGKGRLLRGPAPLPEVKR